MAALDKAVMRESLRDSVKKQTIDFTERRGFNLTNVRIDGLKRPKAKQGHGTLATFCYLRI